MKLKSRCSTCIPVNCDIIPMSATIRGFKLTPPVSLHSSNSCPLWFRYVLAACLTERPTPPPTLMIGGNLANFRMAWILCMYCSGVWKSLTSSEKLICSVEPVDIRSRRPASPRLLVAPPKTLNTLRQVVSIPICFAKPKTKFSAASLVSP